VGKEARKMEMGMAMGAEEMKMGKVTGENSLRWLIRMLMSFSQHGTPLHQRQDKDNLEQEAVSRSPAQDVQFAAMLKINLRMQALVVQLDTRVKQAHGQVAAANALARQAQTTAHGAANVDPFRPAAPPKYGDKKKGDSSMWVTAGSPHTIKSGMKY
jgi:hypothetical protein